MSEKSDKLLVGLETAKGYAAWLAGFSERSGSVVSSISGLDRGDRVTYAVVFTHDADAAGKLLSLAEGITSETQAPDIPKVVCLCGSTRFREAYEDATRRETLAGNIVLSVGMFGHQEGLDMNGPVKAALDKLHLRKIYLADEILVLDVGGYVGESTSKEIEYARSLGKKVRFLEGTG